MSPSVDRDHGFGGMSETTSDDCLFCRIVAGSIPSDPVAQTEHSIAFRDLDPKAPTHVLVVPRRRARPRGAGDGIRRGARRRRGAGRPGGRAGRASPGGLANTGAAAQQSVFHAHLHVIGGRELTWPPG